MRQLSIALLLALCLAHACAEVKLQSVTRKINLNSQFARISEAIKAKNTGSAPVGSLVLCQANKGDAMLALLQVTHQVDDQKLMMKTAPASPSGAPAEASCYEAQFVQPLPAGETATLDSYAVYAEVQKPYPAHVAQGEPQLMLYKDCAYVLSPYQVSQQSTEVILPSTKLKSYSEGPAPVAKLDSNKLKYGKYDLVKPWSVEEMRLHYENGKPFKKATSLVREIEVSHWGNVYVDEVYELQNAGAQHTGPFSRLKHTMATMGGSKGNSFRELKAKLPASARHIYYADQIGNVSTSEVRKNAAETVVNLNTRYPLQGGWKVDFKLGYGVPLEGFLFRKASDGQRRLIMDYGSPVEGLYVEDMTVKVVLPEGSSAISAHVDKDSVLGVHESRDVKYTYLDTVGRPVVVLHSKHVVPDHATKLSVDYSFASVGLLREPLLLITAFAVLFLAAIGYNRLELTISRDEKWQAAQAEEMIATVMQQVYGIVLEQVKLIEGLHKLSTTVRSSDDAEHALKERNRLDGAFGEQERKARELLKGVAETQARAAEKARDVVDKARGLEARCLRHVSERGDLAKKGMAPSEMNNRQAAASTSLHNSQVELQQLAEAAFAPY